MENPSSPLDTLRQLKEMLDAGALTPTEFEALKQRLVFTPPAAAPAAEASGLPPVAPVAPILNAITPAQAVPLPEARPPVPGYGATTNFTPEADESKVPAFEPASAHPFQPEVSADFAENNDYALKPEVEVLADDATDLPAAPAERNSSLGLVLAIGAVLVFLAVVAYLGFTRPTADEHLTSISQTAADSLNTTIETGPQAAPVPTTTAVPETVRVAPTNPAPVIQLRPAAPVADSVAPATNSPVSDSVGNQ
jgi:Short C-terminal domain